jgi:hypothetical protein
MIVEAVPHICALSLSKGAEKGECNG